MLLRTALCCITVFCCTLFVKAQPEKGMHWTADGSGYYEADNGSIVLYRLTENYKSTVVKASQLKLPNGATLRIENFFFSEDGKKLLIYTNSKRVWRYNTRGDYWVLNLDENKLTQLGKLLPASSLMYAKFSPDGTKAAYVSGHNIYVEDLVNNHVTPLTKNGTDRLINGGFDWAYEEEFDCRDGFRWSPDSKSIAYWQIDASEIRNFLMMDYTDSIYSFTKPVEYPTVGESPSACRVGVVDIASAKTTWMLVPGDSRQHYIPGMEWADNSTELIIRQLNRRQNESKVMLCNAHTGSTETIFSETDKAWIDIKSAWNNGDPSGWDWLNDGSSFLWVSEKDGWRHIYLESRDGKKETLVTKGNYDIINIEAVDSKSGYVYFLASPYNATQQYLYRTKINGSGTAELLSPPNQKGTHDYDISPNANFAAHTFSTANFAGFEELVSLPDHKPLDGDTDKYNAAESRNKVEFFTVTTADSITMNGWMIKPENFDSSKKYPLVFLVYGEPGSTTVRDKAGTGNNYLYAGNMQADGYIYASIDGRGSPLPKGAAWRKAIYKKIGTLNIHDQAMGAKKLLGLPYIDTSRVAVWGWSGGASTTLSLLFQYPEIYKTGIAVAAVTNLLTYDNIYEERYMGLPQQDMQPYTAGSPVTYAKNLQGHLLYIHGTGDDNVHYQNAEMLINELVKYNKQFQLMIYPNRTHGLTEGAGTLLHLSTLYTSFLKEWCPPGGR